jgi:2-polyprenyl-3-methyl-5-hydroxy-6-metoxy-1,4-benzoquinol methylase
MKKSLIQELDELENTHWWHKAKRDIFSEYIHNYIKKNKNSRVSILELGAGAGNILAPFKDIADVIALDPDASAIEYAKKRGIKKTIQKTLEGYTDFKPNSVDIIIAADVLEHIKNDEEALKKIWSMLKKNGILLVHVPADQSLFSYWDTALGHFRRYSKNELFTKLSSHQFNVDTLFHRVVLPYPLVKLFRKIKNVKEAKKENINSDFKNFSIFNGLLYKLIQIEDSL